MKRLFLIATVFMLVAFTILTGCSSKNTDSEQKAAKTNASDNKQGQPSGTTSGNKPVKAKVKLGSTSATSSHYAYAVSLANSIKKGTDGNITAEVMETGASVDNTRLMKRGDVDLGLITGNIQYDAYNGTGVFKDQKPFKEMRMMFAYADSPDIIIARADSGVKTLQDLNGKKFSAGIAGSSTQTEVKQMLETLGIKPDFVSATLDDAIEKVKNREIVGLAKAATDLDKPDASYVSLSTLTDVNVIGFTDEQMKTVEEKNPQLVKYEVPANVYKNQPNKVIEFGHISAYAVSNKLSEDVVYGMFKSIIENKSIQEEAFAGVKKFDYLDSTIKSSSIPLHPGVIKYFKEKNVNVPDKLIPKQ
jgi:TRAP transporter TAXI family solute receptor